ncbi:MAG: DUF5329 family protein [Nevskiaceae bacterium]
MTNPDDRELDQYLKGDSALSRRYREASGEASPPDLDEAILARARAELRRKPSLSRVLAPVALAASLVLGVNLAWNVYQAKPVPEFAPEPPAAAPAADAASEQSGMIVELPRPPVPKSEVDRKEVAAAQVREGVDQARVDAGRELRENFARQAEAQRRALKEPDPAGAAAPVIASADPAPGAEPAASALAEARAPVLTEAQKIDWLIVYVGGLKDAVFIRNGAEHSPADAAKHLQLKREKAGSRVRTAGDFIRLCASYSSLSGEAYLIRYADGRTRTAEDVLREELARLSAGG